MRNFKLCFTLTIVYLFESIKGYQSQFEQQRVNFDYFVISQEWPQTNCLKLNKIWQKEDAVCTPCKVPNYWTMHGLWPSIRGHESPFNCNTNVIFKSNLLSSHLKAQLKDKWPSFHVNSTNNYKFLTYEWKKHGTCALSVKETNSLSKYFSTGLALLDHYNVGKILENYQIIPGERYHFHDIYNSIHDALKVNVNVRCTTNPITKEQYLDEVRVCVDTSFNLTDCNDDKHISNCSYENKIVYPKTLKTC